MKSSLKIYFLIFIFFFFFIYIFLHNYFSVSIIFPVKEILIKNNMAINLLKFRSDLSFLINTNLFFLNKEKILETVNKHDFIANIQLKKIYPNTLKILIIEKIPVATQIINKKKFYITKKNEKINFIDLKIYEDLPSISGKNNNFNIFYNDLKKNNFKIKKIKEFHYFGVGRWNVVLMNDKVIKFPEKNYLDILPKINLIIDDNNFSKYKVLDFRIKDQLILK